MLLKRSRLPSMLARVQNMIVDVNEGLKHPLVKYVISGRLRKLMVFTLTQLISQDHHKLNSFVIVNFGIELIKSNPSILIKILITDVQTHFESYSDLPKWMDIVQHLYQLIVQVDDTFLTKRYSDTLLITIAQDENRNMFSLTFSIIEDNHNFEAKLLVMRLEFQQDKWTRVHNGGNQYVHMTTNFTECVNSIFERSITLAYKLS
ncbi:hypothetical protein CR513_40716, partial [Mucuna pruriens]